MDVPLKELAARFDCQLHGDGDIPINAVCTLQQGRDNAISFLANPKYRHHLPDTQASAVILRERDLQDCPVAALIHDNPYACFARIAAYLHPSRRQAPGIHPSAIVAETAVLGKDVSIGPHVVIEDGVHIGERSCIGPGSVLSADCIVGADSRLYSHVTIYPECRIGDRALLHAGVVIGADGFGIAQDQGQWVKVPQTGRVLIGNDVEIGASTTVDRGAIDDTIIEDGVKLDNQIQIGHNVRLGAHTAIAGCVGVAGSANIGRRCTIGAMTLVLGHLTLADDVHITAQSLVTKSISEPGVYSSGTTAQDNRQWRRNVARFSQLDDMAKRLQKLEKQFS